MKLSELDYTLPSERIAHAPVEPRDHARLLVVDRRTGTMTDTFFYELPRFLTANDVLVVNDTKVLPARFMLRRATGGRIEALFIREIAQGRWELMLKNLAKLKLGEELTVDTASTESLPIVFRLAERVSEKTVAVDVDASLEVVDFLDRVGTMPLPPYIHAADGSARDDSHDYQTIYSSSPGAIAAPTAGLHFTQPLMDRIAAMGVATARVTLHVGRGTFEPVTVDDLNDHPMHSEWFSVTESASRTIADARARNGRIVAVGTTSVRVLESAANDAGQLAPQQAWTKILIQPPYRFKAIDMLITNFHLPQTTLLALVYAFAGEDLTRRAYQHAIDSGYRFYSYGDAMLIL